MLLLKAIPLGAKAPFNHSNMTMRVLGKVSGRVVGDAMLHENKIGNWDLERSVTGEYCIRIKLEIFEGSDCQHCSSLMSTFSTNQLDLRRQKCIHLLQLESSAWELVWSHISLSLESCTHLIVSDQCDWKLSWMLRCFLGFHFPVIISTGQCTMCTLDSRIPL